MNDPKGWYSRDYLPHFDRPNFVQGITFRLHDSMPEVLLEQWDHELRLLPVNQYEIERQKRIAAHLDAGHGKCWLRDASIAEIVENAFLHFDGERYRLLAWVVMPNHVHVLTEMKEEWPLDKVIQSWKTWTAKCANKVLKRNGTFWGRDFHDRYIRDGEHLMIAKKYIEENPWKARLCPAPESWRWSSAWKGRQSTSQDN
jgi:REP element-mobilizing transposase RayT